MRCLLSAKQFRLLWCKVRKKSKFFPFFLMKPTSRGPNLFGFGPQCFLVLIMSKAYLGVILCKVFGGCLGTEGYWTFVMGEGREKGQRKAKADPSLYLEDGTARMMSFSSGWRGVLSHPWRKSSPWMGHPLSCCGEKSNCRTAVSGFPAKNCGVDQKVHAALLRCVGD
jgi:hypothetical protein